VPNLLGLTSSVVDMNPPVNTITVTYSWTVALGAYDDMKFFEVKVLAPIPATRYALAFEPSKKTPEGLHASYHHNRSSHLDWGYPFTSTLHATDLNGALVT